MKLVLDSNILIGMYLNDEAIFNYFEKNRDLDLSVSTITLTEVLWHKNITKKEKDHIEALLETIKIVPVDEKIARRALKFREEEKLKTIDSLILATAECEEANLLTRDKQILNINLNFTEKI